MILRLLISAALVTATVGCINVSVGYSRGLTHEPTAQARIDELEKIMQSGSVPLQTCLDALGAPLLVWEAPRGIALAYGHRDQSAWEFNISYSLRLGVPVQLDLATTAADLDGVVLWFDDALRLTGIQRGQLRSLARDGIRRPAAVE